MSDRIDGCRPRALDPEDEAVKARLMSRALSPGTSPGPKPLPRLRLVLAKPDELLECGLQDAGEELASDSGKDPVLHAPADCSRTLPAALRTLQQRTVVPARLLLP